MTRPLLALALSLITLGVVTACSDAPALPDEQRPIARLVLDPPDPTPSADFELDGNGSTAPPGQSFEEYELEVRCPSGPGHNGPIVHTQRANPLDRPAEAFLTLPEGVYSAQLSVRTGRFEEVATIRFAVSNCGLGPGLLNPRPALREGTPYRYTLPAAQVGVAYDFLLPCTGDAPPFQMAISPGALPAGLSMNGAGRITGTPVAAGTASIPLTLTDSCAIEREIPYLLDLTIASP